MLSLLSEREVEDAMPSDRQISPDQTGIQILLWLLRHPFQRVEDMTIALKVHPATVYRYVARHEQAGRIESITPALGIRDTCRLYYLSAVGITTCAQVLRADPVQLSRFWGVDERGLLRLLPRLHALIALDDLINGLVKDAPAQLAFPGGIRSELTWSWVLDYDHRFSYRGHPARATADAALVFHRGAEAPFGATTPYYAMWLFLDTGLCGEHDDRLIRQRLQGLLRYRESPERTFAYGQFPPALIIVQSSRQQMIWQRCANEAAKNLHGVNALKGAIAHIPKDFAFESAWPLSWHDLTTNAPSRIQDLLEPMSEGAVPPGILARSPASRLRTTSLRKRGGLPIGNFSRRVKAVNTKQWTDSETERDAIGLLGLHFSRRHMEVLHLLYVHPWLNTGELAALCGLEQDSAVRYLYELRRFSCAQKDPTDCGQRWRLSMRGLRLIAAHLHFALQHVSVRGEERQQNDSALVQHGTDLLLSQIHHTAAIYDFFARLHLAARDHREAGHRILWFDRGPRCERRYRDGGEWHNFRPDGALAYQCGAERLLAWIEWDEGTMTASQLRTKLEAYARYTRTREWARDGSVILPFLYCIVPNMSQFTRLAALARELLAHSGLTVRITTADRLREHGPLAAIWREVVPIPAGERVVKRHFLDRRGEFPTRMNNRA